MASFQCPSQGAGLGLKIPVIGLKACLTGEKHGAENRLGLLFLAIFPKAGLRMLAPAFGGRRFRGPAMNQT